MKRLRQTLAHANLSRVRRLTRVNAFSALFTAHGSRISSAETVNIFSLQVLVFYVCVTTPTGPNTDRMGANLSLKT